MKQIFALQWSTFLCFQVYLNALGLLLRVHVRNTLDIFEDRLKALADRVKDEVSYDCHNWYETPLKI